MREAACTAHDHVEDRVYALIAPTLPSPHSTEYGTLPLLSWAGDQQDPEARLPTDQHEIHGSPSVLISHTQAEMPGFLQGAQVLDPCAVSTFSSSL